MAGVSALSAALVVLRGIIVLKLVRKSTLRAKNQEIELLKKQAEHQKLMAEQWKETAENYKQLVESHRRMLETHLRNTAKKRELLKELTAPDKHKCEPVPGWTSPFDPPCKYCGLVIFGE